MTDVKMYSNVAKLFEEHDDLLAEFVQFLPDATDLQKQVMSSTINNMSATSMCTASPAKMGMKLSPSMTLYHNSPSTCQRTTYHLPAKNHKRNTSFRTFP
ncbi:hypothetical protein J6590_081246 [Homalodisca vitripennis]|nr:hypothetical protein J6590_081246 [Homalodisca vitripennis]